MHGMHRHQAKRKRGCVPKQRAETAYEHVKACQQHACSIDAMHIISMKNFYPKHRYPEQGIQMIFFQHSRTIKTFVTIGKHLFTTCPKFETKFFDA
jgi:hypothetical protein